LVPQEEESLRLAAEWASESTAAERALDLDRSRLTEDEETAKLIQDLLEREGTEAGGGGQESEQADEDMAVAMRLQSAYDNEGQAGSAQVSSVRNSRRNHGGTTVGAASGAGGEVFPLQQQQSANNHVEYVYIRDVASSFISISIYR
jgi:hypothetical protein